MTNHTLWLQIRFHALFAGLFAGLLIATPFATNVVAAQRQLPQLSLIDTSGKSQELRPTYNRVTILLFLSNDCPISNRYIPELNRLVRETKASPVRWLGVISDATVSRQEAAEFHREYKLKYPLLFDASAELARALEPSHTP